MGKNSKKAFVEGKLKNDYSIDINGKSYGLLSIKGNYTSHKTKNGRTRRNAILKSDQSKSNYLDFYHKTIGKSQEKTDVIKKQEDKKVIKKTIRKKPDLSASIVQASKKDLVKEVDEDPRPAKQDAPPEETFDDPNSKRQRKPNNANIQMNIQGRDPSLGMGMGGFEKSNRGEGGLRGVNAYGSSDGKKEKGIHQGLINKIQGIDYSAVRDEIAKQHRGMKPAQANKMIADLIESSPHLKGVKQRYRGGRMVIKEAIELKAIVRCFELMEGDKGAKDIKMGAVIDLEKMFGLGKIDMDKFKQLLMANNVFSTGAGDANGKVGTTSGQAGSQAKPVQKQGEGQQAFRKRVNESAIDKVAEGIAGGDEDEGASFGEDINLKYKTGRVNQMSVKKAPYLKDTNNFDYQNNKKEDAMKKTTHFRYSSKVRSKKPKRRSIF